MASLSVESVEPIATPETVYNIKVATDHNYFANGVLVHNCDDPHKVGEVESDVARETVNRWWRETMRTRVNDARTAVHLIIMQRIHENDLTGNMIQHELGYEHLCLPMRYEADHPFANIPSRPTKIGFTDPRDVANGGDGDGALLFPERWPAEEVEDLEKNLLVYGTAGQLQQRPSPRGGAFFKREWFELVSEDQIPADLDLVRYWDKAGTDDAGDWTVGVLMGRTKVTPRYFYVLDVVRKQLSVHRREALIKQTADLDAATYGDEAVEIYLEQEPGSSGKDIIALEVENLAGYVVRGDSPSGDKETRARPLADQAEAGNVRVLLATWTKIFLDEFEKFPRGKKDQVDAASGAFKKLALKRDAPVIPKSRAYSLWKRG